MSYLHQFEVLSLTSESMGVEERDDESVYPAVLFAFVMTLFYWLMLTGKVPA